MDIKFIQNNIWLFTVLAVWELIWKAMALWKAARNGQRNWFIALLFINTVGLLPILYFFIYQPKEKLTSIHRA